MSIYHETIQDYRHLSLVLNISVYVCITKYPPFTLHPSDFGASLPSARGRHCEPCRKEIPPWFSITASRWSVADYPFVSIHQNTVTAPWCTIRADQWNTYRKPWPLPPCVGVSRPSLWFQSSSVPSKWHSRLGQGTASPKPLDATSVPINSCPPRYSSSSTAWSKLPCRMKNYIRTSSSSSHQGDP